MKLLIKQIVKAISLCAIICFSALFAVFSVDLTSKNVTFSEKVVSRAYKSRNENVILLPATEENKWASKLKEEVTNLHYEEKEGLDKLVRHSFSNHNNSNTYSGNISNGYHKGSHQYNNDHTITFEFKLKVNGRYVSTGTFDQWIDDHDSHDTKWFTLSGMSRANLKPTDNISIDLTRAYVKGDYEWSAELAIPDVVSQSEFNAIVKNKFSGNTNYFNINSVQLYLEYDGSNESGYNDMKVEIRKITQAKFAVNENTTREDNSEKTLKVKKVFMSDTDIQNNNFSDTQLKDLFDLYIDNKAIDKSNLEYEYINLDKTNKQINLKLKKINVNGSQDYFETPREYHIPIHIINLDYFVEGSISSSSYWDHKANGEVQYHTNKPQTKLRLSENFLKTLYIVTSKKELLEKVEKDNWGFVGNDKNLAINKINDLSLNASNYENVKHNYYNSHDIAVIDRLTFDRSLDKYLTQFNNSKLEDYLYIFKNINVSFKFGIENYEDKSFDLDTLLKGIKVEISDAEARVLDSNRTNWSMHIKDLKIINQNKNWAVSNKWLFDLPDDNFSNYDLSLEYGSSSRELIHKYLYQAHGMDISQNVSFIMEDGTVLDQDFKVTKASSESDLSMGDEAYVAIRYWTKFVAGQEEYVTIIKKNNSWYSEKYQKEIIDLDSSFNESKIEYLFNQALQMVINPYQNSAGTAVTSSTPQSFGIKRVTDTVEGNAKVLEDWNDGLWSHSHNAQGRANFDGIFGSDINGIFDSRGRLTQGKHHINVELQNSVNSQVKNSFYINIDNDPVEVEVNGVDSSVKQIDFMDDQNGEKTLYFANGPIHFKVDDIDIKDVKASFINNQGHWYDLPINIKSRKIDNSWKQVIDSTIDYAGFAKVIITDRADNQKILYFWLKQNGDEDPEINFDYSLLFDRKKRMLNNDYLNIFNDKPQLVISSPLVDSLKVSKQELDKGQWADTNINSYDINDYLPNEAQSYNFAKPIGSTQGVLKYAGDELKPFINQNSDSSWPVTNKVITFNEKGLYKITLNSRFIDNKIITKYIYINDDSVSPVNLSLLSDEETNFKDMPLENKGSQDNIDSEYKMTDEININFPSFLIKNYKVYYSQLWYSEFNEINNLDFNFTREGKYKIYIKDIYGKEYKYELLLLKKNIDATEREANHMINIYDPETQKDEIDNKAFWKGKMTWNYYRYEDEDHAKWEHDNFIREAIRNGLSREEAEALYRHMKGNPDWDGNLKDSNGKVFNFQKENQKYLDSQNNFKTTNKLSKGSVIGIAIGTSLFGMGSLTLIIWFLRKRIISKRLK